ncbi:MAG: hypothetical protein ACRCXX_13510 [Cetobacterium sp.]|uniref:hypothetical protein n=1 Tax=Cetobacterium sp. TaxID=2071632 RepID=UPI003F406C1C
MTGVTKTVLEWLSFVKIEEKKLNRKREELEKKPFLVKLKDEKVEFDAEVIKSQFKSITDIQNNILKVKSALTVYNATNKVTVDGNEYPIAHALFLYKNGETDELRMFKRMNARLNVVKLEKDKESYRKCEEIEKTFLSKTNNTQKDKDYMTEKKKDLEVEVVDPISIQSTFSRLTEEHDSFMEKINTQINLKNSTTTLTIDLA